MYLYTASSGEALSFAGGFRPGKIGLVYVFNSPSLPIYAPTPVGWISTRVITGEIIRRL